jgi:hypothetical protein
MVKNSFAVEIVIPTTDVSILQLIRNSAGKDVSVEEFRSVTAATVLLTAAAAVKLLAALLELRKKLRERADTPTVKVKGIEGEAIDLLKATDETLKRISDLAS